MLVSASRRTRITAGEEHETGARDQLVFERRAWLWHKRKDHVAKSQRERPAEDEGDRPDREDKRDRPSPPILLGDEQQVSRYQGGV